MPCPVCDTDGSQVGWVGGKDILQVSCAQCGPFFVTGTMAGILSHVKDKEKFIVSAYLRERELRGLPPPTIFSGGANPKAEALEGSFNVSWDVIVAQEFPNSISERLDRTLCNFSRMAIPGKWMAYLGEVNWVTAFAEDEDSWRYLVDQLKEDKLVEEINSKQPGEMPLGVLRLTPKGWNRVADIEGCVRITGVNL